MSERLCPAPECGKPLVRREGETPGEFLRRETCGVRCGWKLGRLRSKQNGTAGRPRDGRVGGGDQSWRYTGWPTVTGEIDWNNAFAKGNIQTNDGGPFRMAKPVNHSPSGSAAAWMMEWARG